MPTANPDPYPPKLGPYLNSTAVTSKIGSQSPWGESSDDIFNQFAATGDAMRSSRPNLETVINAGVHTVIYVGDADYILNYIGVEAMVRTSQVLSKTPTRSFVICIDSPAICIGRLLKDETLSKVREAAFFDL